MAADNQTEAIRLNSLANQHWRCGDLPEAIQGFTKALSLAPDCAPILANRAAAYTALAAAGDPAALSAALQDGQAATAFAPDLPEAHFCLGVALHASGHLEAAASSLTKALSLRPDYAEAALSLGGIHLQAGRLCEARMACQTATLADPNSAAAWSQLAGACLGMGLREEAKAAADRALALAPFSWDAALRAVVAELPLVAVDEADRLDSIKKYEDALRALCLRFDCAGAAEQAEAGGAVGMALPFVLPGLTDDALEPQRLQGGFTARAMAAAYPQFSKPMARQSVGDDRLRIGIVSAYFRRHSIWKIPLSGWLDGLDPARFQVFAYHTSAQQDIETRQAARRVSRFDQGPLPTALWAKTIIADRLHVLLYPEIGMDPATLRLAALRLAPIQAVFGGHPVTTGLPTIDIHLTSDLMEPVRGESQYSEKVVRLPNLGVDYRPRPVPAHKVNRTELGLAADEIVFWCGQSLHKFRPTYDHVFPRIAAKLGQCRFLFVANGRAMEATRVFEHRLAAAFAACGLESHRFCLMLPEMDEPRYGGTSGLCDLFLDPIGWSGNNTTMEALAQSLPVVTLPGSTMRSRHAYAILTRLGLPETIAEDDDDYVGIAVRLANDPAARLALRRRIAAARHRLYDDQACRQALADFLLEVAT